jgi:phosphoglycolate phosphatase-like HAD superfamily hydrolase
MASPDILALDFDGVVCDGLIEYFQTAWRAYCELFNPDSDTPPEGLAERFYPLRPVIETGWEMPLLLYGLLQDIADEDILQHWPEIVPRLLADTGVEAKTAAQAVDGVRDRWIHTDLQNWLDQHRFYPGVLNRLRQAMDQDMTVMIISTKEGRFIRQLLSQQGLDLPEDHILGKEIKQPKYETLRQVKAQQPGQEVTIWFVEDRLKALQAVKTQADLTDVQLFLAEWGYNTTIDRAIAAQDGNIRCLTLDRFCGPFSAWQP